MVIDEAHKPAVSASINFRFGAALPKADIKVLTKLLHQYNQRHEKGPPKAKAEGG